MSEGFKRGPLTEEDRKTIKSMASDGYSIDEIARAISRRTKLVKAYLSDTTKLHPELRGEENQRNIIIGRLKKHNCYRELKKQFSEDELRYFEVLWSDLITQFNDDVLPSEELQIRQLVTIDILINRCLKERKVHVEEVQRLQSVVDYEYSLPEDQRDTNRLMNMETQLSYARNSLTSYTNEYTKLLDEQKSIQKDLKSTREQRIKRIEDSKTSFAGWIRSLEEEDVRARLGDRAEVMRLAKNRAKSDLMDYHAYADGEVDRPLLTPESVERESEE